MEIRLLLTDVDTSLPIEDLKELVPVYATSGSVGLDLCARSLKALYNGTKTVFLEKVSKNLKNGYFFLGAGERALIGTGIALEIPEGYEGQIRPKSGLALKKGIMVVNSPGTIDQDFRAEIGVIIINTTSFPLKITLGEEIAQLVICPVVRLKKFILVTELSQTERGEGGFGSTTK